MKGGGFVKKWMTVPEVAMYFSCSRRYVYTLIERGSLEVINIGATPGARGIRIDSVSVQTFGKEKIDDSPEY